MSASTPPTPELEVVVCTYNNAPLLERTLQSLSHQSLRTDASWACLVVQNNCTDDTAEVLERHVESGSIPGLRTVNEPVQGLTPARATGVRSTTAPWIAFVDDDCALAPNWVEGALRLIRRHPESGALGGQVVLEWEREPPAWLRPYGYCYAEQRLGDAEAAVPFLVGAGLVASRAALDACGWTDRQWVQDRIGKRLVSGGDVEMVLRIASTGCTLVYSPLLELRHWVPQARTRRPYLIRMHLGLGGSAAWADALTAPSARGWRRAARRAVRQHMRDAAKTSVDTLRRWARPVDVVMKGAFLTGYARTAARLAAAVSDDASGVIGAAHAPSTRR